MILRDALNLIRQRLTNLIGEFAQPESEIILETVLHLSRTRLYSSPQHEITDADNRRIHDILERRLGGEPLAYILGKTFFFCREFIVSPDVLIPRPDTEVLVETILESEGQDGLRFADLGTGSGIIAAVLTENRVSWHGIGVDISPAALQIARRNAGQSVSFVLADLLEAFRPGPLFDLIVSNPPYIAQEEFGQLDRSVVDYEPHLALKGGVDGLDFYRRIAASAARYLKPDGRLYCEIGYDQGTAVTGILEQHGWKSVRIRSDLGGNPRVVSAFA